MASAKSKKPGTRADADQAFDLFLQTFETKYPNGIAESFHSQYVTSCWIGKSSRAWRRRSRWPLGGKRATTTTGRIARWATRPPPSSRPLAVFPQAYQTQKETCACGNTARVNQRQLPLLVMAR